MYANKSRSWNRVCIGGKYLYTKESSNVVTGDVDVVMSCLS